MIERHFGDEKEAKIWMIDNQISRRNLTSAARISLELLKKDLLSGEARNNSLANLKQFQPTDNQYITDPPDLAARQTLFEKGAVRDVIAKEAGVSHGTVDKFLFIKEHASEDEMNRLCSGSLDLEGNTTTSGS